jgi:hypothetical protein
MPTILRIFVLVLPLLISFPALADNGLADIGESIGRLLILVGWFLGSVTLLIIGFVTYTRKKIAAAAFLVYFSLASLTIFYRHRFADFLHDKGDLLSNDAINSAERDGAVAGYRILIAAGCVLTLCIAAFILYHVKTRQKRLPRLRGRNQRFR